MSTILTVTDINVHHNDRVLLDRVSLTLDEADRTGMVGRNGSGKSTLLRIMAGLQQPDSGEITQRRGLTVSYLPQEIHLAPGQTVIDHIRGGAQPILDLIHEFETLPPDSPKHAQLEQQIQLADGWGLDHRIATAMTHLNCPAGERLLDTLSGGEQRRVALCRAIISQPDLLLLDEPTNHLDAESIAWIVDYLETYPGAFLLVTHDRYFLDRVTNRMVELAAGAMYSYTGNYTDYLIARAEREAAEEVLEHKRQMFLRRELDWVRRGPKARTTKSKSRLDHYFEVAGQTPPELERDVDLVIPTPPPLGNRTVDLVGIGMALGGKTLFNHLNFHFQAGQRVGITGRNGLGKTTLLKIILGQLQPTAGSVKLGQLIRFNYVDQGRLQLNEDQTVLEEISDGTEFVVFGEHRLSLRGYLKRFLFTDERISTQVKYLSGGERSRLLLARILKNGGNFLILDEPTNDLDLPTLRILEEALIVFPGVVVVVSHDRYFLNRVCTDILAFEGDGRVIHSVGNYDYYVEKCARRASLEPTTKSLAAKKPNQTQAKPASSRPRRLTSRENQELVGMETAIEAAETNIARIEALFMDPDFHRQYGRQVNELTTELAAEKERLTRLYERWQELEAIRAQQP